MCLFCKKFIFILYYQRAINLASKGEYLDAIRTLHNAPFKEIFFLYFLLAAFLYEGIGKFDESLILYDKARYLIYENEKLNQDEKQYLYKYINNSYIFIYEQQHKLSKADSVKKENSKIVFNIEKVNKNLQNDFVMV